MTWRCAWYSSIVNSPSRGPRSPHILKNKIHFQRSVSNSNWKNWWLLKRNLVERFWICRTTFSLEQHTRSFWLSNWKQLQRWLLSTQLQCAVQARPEGAQQMQTIGDHWVMQIGESCIWVVNFSMVTWLPPIHWIFHSNLWITQTHQDKHSWRFLYQLTF